jgi:anti-anti-sigma factor
MEEITIKDSLKITPMQVGGGGKTVQLILTGYLDTYNSPEFQNHVNQLIDSGIIRIIFNCNGLNYISSTGIGAFTAFLKNLKQRKGDMVLFGLQHKVLDVFQLLGFTKFFKIGDDLDTALAMLEGTDTGVPAGGKGPTDSTPSAGEAAEAETPQEPASAFPLVFECPHCAKKLKASKPGKYRCSGCSGIIQVDEQGAVQAA